MRMIETFVQNPVKISVGVLLVALFGFIAVMRMPMQLTPEVQTPTLTIETRWPGASPQEVEREIVQEQERQLKGVEGMVKMTSESMDSQGRITLEFAVGSDMREALLKVNTRLQQVREYPEDADEPIIRTANLSDRPIAWFILSPRPPKKEELRAFQANHPHLAERLAPVLRAANDGVAVRRLQALAGDYPEVSVLLPPDVDVTRMRKYAEDVIESRFERVTGVSDANVLGGREEEVQVIVDPEKLAARRVTIGDLRLALRGQNHDTSGGDFWEGKRRWVVRTLGQFRSPAQVADTVIGYSDNPDDPRAVRSPIYVRDVADVRPGHKKAEGLVRRFGTERLAINCIRENNANVIDVMQRLREAVQELNEGPLKIKGLELTQVYDETDYINSAVGLVRNNIVVGGLLTIAILLLFLRSVRSVLVIGLAIPTSIVGTFLALYIMGRSLNVISLAGMAFAVGMLVDNAVVVLENIYRLHQLGVPRIKAVVRATQEVWGAVLASTLTTLAVFLPVLFVEEEAGQLFRDISLAISCGIALSLVVSLTVIPTAAARLLPPDRDDGDQPSDSPERLDLGRSSSAVTSGVPQKRHPLRILGGAFSAVVLTPLGGFGRAFVGGVVELNRWLQSNTLYRLAAVLGFVGLAIGLSWWFMPKVEYLPSGNRNLVIGIMLPPPGYNLNQMLAIGTRFEEDLRPYWDIDEDTDKNLDYPAVGDYFFVARGRQLFMGLRAQDPNRTAELIPLIRKVAGRTPGMFIVAKQASLFERGLSAGRTVDVEITGPDLPKLVRLGGQVLGQVPQVIPNSQAIPQPSLDLSSPEVHILPRREKAAEMGMTAEELGYAVDVLVDGAYATDYFIGGDKIDLRIIARNPMTVPSLGSQGPTNMDLRTHELESLPVATRTSDVPVPLKALAKVRLRSGPEQINHRERLRAITIQVSPPPDVPLEEAMDRIRGEIVQPLIDSNELEGGLYQINLAGTADKLRATWQALRLQFLLALLITYLLLAALFESWLYPVVIIVSVPLGAVGGFLALRLLNVFILQPLDVLTMLGFVILIGTVVNNPILIVQQALIHIREEGMPMQQAILESVRNRIRPIFMTTTTTVFGLVPLVLFPGAGSELYRGLGAVVLGGLLASTIVSLVVVPALFSLTMQTYLAVTGKSLGAEKQGSSGGSAV